MGVNRYAILLAFTIALSCINRKTEEQPKQERQSGQNTTAMREVEVKQAEKFDTVIIGSQVWMVKNLDVSHFRNGDKIPYAATAEEWQKATENKSPAWCYYDNDEANGEKYGKLYNWYAVNDLRGLAPKGWKIPNNEDWKQLKKQIGNPSIYSKDLMSTTDWLYVKGTNKTGFNAFPSGGRFLNGKFEHKGESAFFWGADNGKIKYDGFERGCSLFLSEEFFLNDSSGHPKEYGLSVRCIK